MPQAASRWKKSSLASSGAQSSGPIQPSSPPSAPLAFDEVRERIGLQMRRQAQATALRQYLAVLAGQADLRGVDLEGASSPLVQ